jgi:hypothetical protein
LLSLLIIIGLTSCKPVETTVAPIYRDDQGNWQLFNIDTLDSIPITLCVAGLTLYPVWSFDGQYLSFSPRNEHYELIDGTIIFKIP